MQKAFIDIHDLIGDRQCLLHPLIFRNESPCGKEIAVNSVIEVSDKRIVYGYIDLSKGMCYKVTLTDYGETIIKEPCELKLLLPKG